MFCNKCSTEKSEEDFCFKNKRLNIKHSVCKECQKSYKITYYNSNKESHYIRNKKTNTKLDAYIEEYKLQNPCRCGESATECLDFHHLQDKDIEIAKLRNMGSFKRLKLEMDKCIILCANCHRKLHAGTLQL